MINTTEQDQTSQSSADLSTASDSQTVKDFVSRGTRKGQNIALPGGLSTGGLDRTSTANTIFPRDMSGKTVLDIGSFTGFFCFEALQRGAEAATGFEVDAERIAQAKTVADVLDLHPDFRKGDIERDTIDGQYDYVLCLNVLHHMKDPIAVIDKLIDVTRERLVLEVATLGRHDRPKLGISPLANLFLRHLPLIVVGGHRKGKKKVIQKFFITPAAMRNLLAEHRKVFSKVEIVPSQYKDRFIVLAHKRRIGRMVVVAGATSAGKSTLIQRITDGKLPQVAQKVGAPDLASWKTVAARTLKKMEEPQVEKLIFHYDFLRPQFKPYEYDDSLDVLDCADDVTFLTIWTPPQRLKAQLEKGEIAPNTKNGTFQGNKFKRQLRSMYEDPAAVCDMYRNWFAFCSTKPGRHLIVTFEGEEPRFYTVEEWEQQIAAPLTAQKA